jgi:hypothetical protein
MNQKRCRRLPGRRHRPRPGTPHAASPSSGTSRLWSSYCRPQTMAAMPRRAAWGLTPVVSHRAMNCGGTSTSRTLGCFSMAAFLDSPDAHRRRRWRFRAASRAGASRFAPQLASTLTRRARCDTGTTTVSISRHIIRAGFLHFVGRKKAENVMMRPDKDASKTAHHTSRMRPTHGTYGLLREKFMGELSAPFQRRLAELRKPLVQRIASLL